MSQASTAPLSQIQCNALCCIQIIYSKSKHMHFWNYQIIWIKAYICLNRPKFISKDVLFYMCVCACMLSHFSVSNSCDPMSSSPPGSSIYGFSRQEYWSGLPCPSPGDFPDLGLLSLLHCQAGSLPLMLPRKPIHMYLCVYIYTYICIIHIYAYIYIHTQHRYIGLDPNRICKPYNLNKKTSCKKKTLSYF